MKTRKKAMLSTIALGLVAVLMGALAINPGMISPTVEEEIGVKLQDYDSTPASVTVEDCVVEKEIPRSTAITLLNAQAQPAAQQTPAATTAQPAAEAKTNAETNASAQETKQAQSAAKAEKDFDAGLQELLVLGAQSTAVKSEKQTGSLMSFAQSILGETNPVQSTVDVATWLSKGVKNLKVTLEPVSKAEAGVRAISVDLMASTDTVQEFYFHFNDAKGNYYSLASGVYFDRENLLIYGKDEKGIFAFGYDADLGNLMLYTPVDAWQRNFGFCRLYDILSPAINAQYQTVRIKFEYDGLDWLIQFWKGRYSIGMGGEIGVYSKDKKRLVEFYDCATDEQLMPMSMQIYRGDKLLVDRNEEAHWWLSGFKLATPSLPSSLTLKGSITFPKKAMADAFVNATPKAVKTVQDGTKVSFTW